MNHERTQTIQVESRKILKLEFTHFAVSTGPWPGDVSTCPSDYVTITDGDGTILMDRKCGFSAQDYPSDSGYFVPPVITSRTNRVEILFHTDGNGYTYGWRLVWAALTPGMMTEHRMFPLHCNRININISHFMMSIGA